ncbi:exonuclease RecJ [Halobium salinum]|uniref:Exonuclease RecJ n=1 Tax=Halobium salinum TaxID=1364940 RepID=A0ABD5P7Y2_9EURY|nr:exonuclease RecJ [Halobium salinum]
MSTAPAPTEDADAPALASALRDAPFVRLAARADGDALAAAGVLARALRATGVPFQARTAPDPVVDSTDDGLAVTVGTAAAGADLELASRPASATAFAVARELVGDPVDVAAAGENDTVADPVIALAGVVAHGDPPGEHPDVLDAAESRDLVARRPGVAVPTADLADGLAHSTLLSAPFSGTPDAAGATLAELGLPAELDDEAGRRVASAVALEAATAAFATPRAAASVERALHPYATPEGPFETVGGYADVLDAVARERPGTGVALALGHDARTPALETWRDHARVAHGALADATTGRYDGLFVARVESDLDADAGDTSATPVARSALETAARLLRDFRSPESVALVVSEGSGTTAAHAAVASVDPRNVGEALSSVADVFDGEGYGTARRGAARFGGDTTEFIAALREALG